MKFSVLLSLYYKESPTCLCESLDSLFAQTLLPNEIILVKDGPVTPELDGVVGTFVANHPEMRVVALKENMGLGKALNEGLKYCSYDLVARMDTDDICKLNRFERQVEFMEKHPEVDVVGAWIDEFQQDISNVTSTRKLPETHEDIVRFGQQRNPMNHPVVMFRKKAVEAVGSYQSFYLFEDYYLWVRMLLNGSKFHNIQESLLFFRSSRDVFRRRGGFKYACVETRFQWTLYKSGYIGPTKTCMNVCIHFPIRVIPNTFRCWIYKRLLRKL